LFKTLIVALEVGLSFLLLLSGGDFSIQCSSPISITLWIMAAGVLLVTLLMPMFRNWRHKTIAGTAFPSG